MDKNMVAKQRFEQSVAPTLKTAQCLGMIPLTFRLNEAEYRESAADVLYCSVSTCVVVLLQIFVLCDLSGTGSLTRSGFSDVIDTWSFTFSCVLAYFSQIIAFPRLLKVLYKLRRLCGQHTVAGISCLWVRILVFTSIVYEVIYTVLSIHIAPYQHKNYTFYVIETLTYALLELTNFVIGLLFCQIVLTCRNLFHSGNLQLINIKDPSDFLLVSQRYSAICSVCTDIDEVFGLQNLFSVFLIFMEITYGVYSGIKNVAVVDVVGDIIHTTLWCGYFLVKLIAVLTVCQYTLREAEITGDIIRRLSLIQNDLFVELETTSLQLIHSQPSFSAAGLFQLDFTLLYSMTAAIAGNLILLIQSDKLY